MVVTVYTQIKKKIGRYYYSVEGNVLREKPLRTADFLILGLQIYMNVQLKNNYARYSAYAKHWFFMNSISLFYSAAQGQLLGIY